jgi:hypothetical protein
MAMQNKVLIQIDGETVELTGEEKTKFLADQKFMQTEDEISKKDLIERQKKRDAVLEKLGLQADEIKLLFG